MSITAARFFAGNPRDVTPSVEDRFFNELRNRNATFKTTGSERLADLDAACVAHFGRRHARLREVLDVGASSGTTTIKLAARLRTINPAVQVTGTDNALDGHLVELWPGLRTLLDDAGEPLQHDLFGVAIRPWRRRADFLSGMLLIRALLNRTMGRRARGRVLDKEDSGTRVQLVSPRIALDPGIQMDNSDIFTRDPRYVARFDFVRAANVLNHGYFEEAALRRGIVNAISYLSGPEAWLLLARTVRGKHSGTLFQVSQDGRRLEVIERFGGGSEVERLVLDAPLPDRA